MDLESKRRPIPGTPIPVLRALRKLGNDIRDARRRRRIPVAIMAERASISRMTMNRVEKGEPGVSMGIYAPVLFVLGLVERLADLADPRNDPVGLALEAEHLPQRIRSKRRQKPAGPKNRNRSRTSGAFCADKAAGCGISRGIRVLEPPLIRARGNRWMKPQRPRFTFFPGRRRAAAYPP